VHLFSSPQSLILSICHSLLPAGQLHPTVTESVISPLLKKSTLDTDQLSNYRPISNFSHISKIIERVVKSRITEYITSNKLLNPHQSAYCKHHSTETALLYIHDHLINAIASQQLSCVCVSSTFPLLLTPVTIASYPPVILVRYPWLCPQLVQVILIISLLPCQM